MFAHLCVTQPDALQSRCVYLPSGHDKKTTKYDIMSNLVKMYTALEHILNDAVDENVS